MRSGAVMQRHDPDALDSIADLARDALIRAARLQIQLAFARARLSQVQGALDELLALSRRSHAEF